MLRHQRDWLLDRFVADTNSEDRDLGAGIVELLDHILDIAEGHEPNVSVTNITAAVDAQIVMRWLASRFLDEDCHEELGLLTEAVRAKREAALNPPPVAGLPAPAVPAVKPVGALALRPEGRICRECHSSDMVRTGSCESCRQCDSSNGGCS